MFDLYRSQSQYYLGRAFLSDVDIPDLHDHFAKTYSKALVTNDF